MATAETICEWLDIDLDRLTGDDKVNLIGEICNVLTAQELRRVREVVEEKQNEKKEDVKAQLREQIQELLAQADLSIEDVMDVRRGRGRQSTLPLKYRDPGTGKTWSGQGRMPKWLREVEQAGGNIENFIITEEVLKPGDIVL